MPTFADMRKETIPHLLSVWCFITLTLLVAMFPHHHHGEAVCVAWNRCGTTEQPAIVDGSHRSSHNCDESDCVVQTMRTFLPATSHKNGNDGLTWHPLCLPSEGIDVPECPVFELSREMPVCISLLFYGCHEAAVGRAPPRSWV